MDEGNYWKQLMILKKKGFLVGSSKLKVIFGSNTVLCFF